ncbi:MAG: pantetheine-phosphate adenylyltransferase [Gammaproteobacteria bacterium]|nr:pantetheine-phosphate adenylyltransferase [Gammaproteobacteria bacterium]
MKTLVFPGSFDPFTNSHLDLALRAQGLFDRVIVAVRTREGPDARRDVEDRAALVRLALKEYEGFEVEIFDGLLVDYLHSRDAQFVLRGMRTIADFEHEFQRVDMTRQLDPEIEFVFLAPSEQLLLPVLEARPGDRGLRARCLGLRAACRRQGAHAAFETVTASEAADRNRIPPAPGTGPRRPT